VVISHWRASPHANRGGGVRSPLMVVLALGGSNWVSLAFAVNLLHDIKDIMGLVNYTRLLSFDQTHVDALLGQRRQGGGWKF
jgi:hypothetical protein